MANPTQEATDMANLVALLTFFARQIEGTIRKVKSGLPADDYGYAFFLVPINRPDQKINFITDLEPSTVVDGLREVATELEAGRVKPTATIH